MGNVTVWSSVRMDWVGRKILEVIRLTVATLPYDFCITSGTDGDHGSSSHHYANLSYDGSETAALDIGCWNSKADGDLRARTLARELYEHSNHTVELIVSGVGSGLNNVGGFYVKNRVRVAPYAVADHYDHIHLATSAKMADLWLADLRGAPMFTDLNLR